MVLLGKSYMPITKARKTEIETIASAVLEQALNTGNIKPPINLPQIIKFFGLKITIETLEDGVSGELDRSQNLIRLSPLDEYPRAAFTVGHELGHFLLHKDKEKDVFRRSDMISPDMREEEQEANCFAASLLMPKDYFTKAWLALKNKNDLATLFGVSSTAVHWRLKNLDLI